MQGFIETITRFQDRWISAEIAEHPRQMAKARLLLGICVLCGPAIILILSVAWFSLPESRAQTLGILFGHCVVCSTGFLVRWTKSVVVPGTCFMFAGSIQVLGATYLTGSLISPVVYSYPVLVLVAGILVEFRVGFWAACILLVGSYCIWLPSYPEYRLFTDHAPIHIRTLTLAWCMATATAVAWLYTVESRRAASQLERAAAEKDRFMASLSHELRNPLTTILGVAELLALSERDDRTARLVDALQRSATGMAQVLDDVLDISKDDAGMLELVMEPVAIRPLMEGIVAESGPLAETRGMDLRLDMDVPADSCVSAAPKRLQQVLRNLVSNGLKFTQEGGVVTLSVGIEGPGVFRIAVSDTGIGIKESNLETILQPFRQAGSDSSHGTGLGLSITCRLLHRMGSSLAVESELGVGSSFSFLLETVEPEPLQGLKSEQDPNSAETTDPSIDLTGFAVMLADDNAEARGILRGLLLELGCVVETASDGVEVLEKVAVATSHVFLLDIQMPGLDGVEVAKELRRRFAAGQMDTVDLIAVTGNVNAPKELIRDGLFDHVLAKPVGLRELRACLEQVVRKNRAAVSG